MTDLSTADNHPACARAGGDHRPHVRRGWPGETQFTALDFKSVADDGRFEGYASLFGKADLGRDVVLPGAFSDSLKRRGSGGVKLLFQHDPAEPIGTWELLEEDKKGLRCVGRLMPEIRRAAEILALMRAGALDGLSIGFRVVRSDRDRAAGLRRLQAVDLWEISVVTFPMQPEARVDRLENTPRGGGRPTEREFERWLTRDAGLSRREARLVVAEGFRALGRKLDAAPGAPTGVDLSALIRGAAGRLRAAAGPGRPSRTIDGRKT